MLLKPGEETHSYERHRRISSPYRTVMYSSIQVERKRCMGGRYLKFHAGFGHGDTASCGLCGTVEEEQVEGMKGTAGHDHDEGDYDDARMAAIRMKQMTGKVRKSPRTRRMNTSGTSPVNASLIVEQIKNVLSQADPDHSELYEENTLAYQEQLSELDQEFREVVDNAKRDIMIFGDRFPFRYFADEYGLEYYAAFPGCAGDTEPSAGDHGISH